MHWSRGAVARPIEARARGPWTEVHVYHRSSLRDYGDEAGVAERPHDGRRGFQPTDPSHPQRAMLAPTDPGHTPIHCAPDGVDYATSDSVG